MSPRTDRPYLFDTSAESWIARAQTPEVSSWMNRYLDTNSVHVSAITVLERVHGYSLLWRRARSERRVTIENARVAYLSELGHVWPVDASIAVVAGELFSLLPDPPTPPRQTHRHAESRQDRISRWRFDQIIAATALVAGLPLIHNNPADFEYIRSAVERAPARFPHLGPLELIRCTSLVAPGFVN